MCIPQEIQREILTFLPADGFNAAWNTAANWREFLKSRADLYIIRKIQRDQKCHKFISKLPNGILHGILVTAFTTLFLQVVNVLITGYLSIKKYKSKCCGKEIIEIDKEIKK